MTTATFTESEILACRTSGRSNLRFPPAMESAYRGSQDRRYRLSRTILFCVCTVSILLGALNSESWFNARPEAFPLILAIQLGWAAPVLLLAAVMQYRKSDRNLRYALNIAANVGLWASCLSLHLLCQFGLLDYPQHMVNISVLAVAVFGGFRTLLIIFGGSLAIGLSLAAFLLFHESGYPVIQFAFETAHFWLIGIVGALVIDLLNREAWLSRARIRALARIDRMTGLLNRGAFNDLYARVVAQAARERRYIAVALIDVDHFKAFNDQHGHLKGDEALAAVGRALGQARSGRPMDLRARYGGEEFIAVWYDVKPGDADFLGIPFLEAIRAIRLPAEHGETDLRLTASLGVVVGVPDREKGDSQLIRIADEQLYLAKNNGRNQIRTTLLDASAAGC